MKRPFAVLHISDLHRSPRDPISNDELMSALIGDRDRYIGEDPPVPAPQAIVVSGDLIQGVPLDTADFGAELVRQYMVAEEFLDELVRRFLDGDRSRLIMVPGNHDIDWNTAFAGLELVERKDFPENLAASLNGEYSEYRWDWKSLALYRIADPALYARRLEAFWTFFDMRESSACSK
jgi:3',5'-cyclic AMP phosphodiesterase CpdA